MASRVIAHGARSNVCARHCSCFWNNGTPAVPIANSVDISPTCELRLRKPYVDRCVSSTSSVASEDSASDSSEPGCEPSHSVKSTRTAEQFSLDIGLTSLSTETLPPSAPKLFATPTSSSITAGLIKNPEEVAERFRQSGRSRGHFGNVLLRQALMSSAAAFPARTSASPERVLVLQARGVDSGANTRDSFASFDPATSSWRTSQRCLVEGWSRYSETWPRSGMTRNGTAYRLPTLVPLTGETEFGSWPTPRAEYDSGKHRGQPDTLHSAVKMWPTPTAINDTGGAALCKWGGARSREKLRTMVTPEELNGALNPTWVEWLMGFPLGWTVLEHWVTRSSRKSLRSSGER